jgi:precorrin-4 methylase
VAIVRRVTWPDQQTIHTTLAEVANLIEREGVRPPAVIIVGNVAEARKADEGMRNAE